MNEPLLTAIAASAVTVAIAFYGMYRVASARMRRDYDAVKTEIRREREAIGADTSPPRWPRPVG